MLTAVYAFVTVMAWGTWLVPSQNVDFPNQQLKTFYVALGNFVLASIVLLYVGSGMLSWSTFWLPFLGGLIWAASGYCAFTATHKLGIARAFGTWAPLNIIVGIIWGMVLWDEFLKSGTFNLALAIVSVVLIIIGVLFIVLSGGKDKENLPSKTLIIGFSGALGAGILWGTYFIPSSILSKNTGISPWIAAFPLATGMLAGSAVINTLGGNKWSLQNIGEYSKTLTSGALWSIGNFTMLLLVAAIGAGKGFTISQLSVVVNALFGIFLLHEPAPKTRAAKLTLIGVILATLGGVILGNLK